MSATGVTPFKRHALHAWVPDSRHVSLSRCDGVYLLTYLEKVSESAEGRTRRPRVLYLQLWHPPSRLLSLITGTARRQRATAVSDHDRARTLYSRPQGDQVADTQGP